MGTPKITLVHPSQWLSAASLSRASRSSSAPPNSAALLLSSASSPTTSPRLPITAFPSAYTSRPLRAFPAQQCFTPSLLSSWSAASAALHSSLLWAWSSISHSVELSHTLPGLTHATDGSCSGFVRTAHGNGYTNLDNDVVGGDGGVTILPSLRTACRLQKAAFAVAIIGCVFFFISIF